MAAKKTRRKKKKKKGTLETVKRAIKNLFKSKPKRRKPKKKRR